MALDPYQDEEQARAAAEVAARLRQRGIALTGAERPDDLADLLSAVERFEAVVEAQARSRTTVTSSSHDAGTARPYARTSSGSTRRRHGYGAIRGNPTSGCADRGSCSTRSALTTESR